MKRFWSAIVDAWEASPVAVVLLTLTLLALLLAIFG
jgi:hypothetical protein